MRLINANTYRAWAVVLWLMLGLLLTACQQTAKPADFMAQREFFNSAIKQAQQAGTLLQSQPDAQHIAQAMSQLDQAMVNANSVEPAFLQWLDQGLYQAFSAYFIKGIENYRLGVEGSDQQLQAKGIQQLQHWWSYWQQHQAKIEQQLHD